MAPELRSERLLLRPYTPADEDDFVALLTDPEVTRWMGMPARPVREMFRRAFDPATAPDWDVWLIERDGAFVGHAELKPSPHPRVDGHELVYALARTAWGAGLGSETARALTAYGHERLGLAEVHATVDEENAASLALLRRLGYADRGEVVDEDGDACLHLVHEV